MNAADTIQAAIDKLEGRRSASDDNPTPSTWVMARDGWGVEQYYAPNEERMEVIGRDIWPADADLIVTLHRTIDAQLKTLRDVYEARLIEAKWPTLIYTENALLLARAILGDDS